MVFIMASKEELVRKAKELAENENLADVAGRVTELRKQWRRPDDNETLYEQELAQQFNDYLAAAASRGDTISQSVEERKNEIIAKAKEVLNDNSIKRATASMNELMEQWKVSGHLEKEKDDEMWNQFKEVRNEFFAKRKAHYEQLAESFANNKAAKEQLIEEAKNVNTMENMKQATAKMNELMENWKKVGNAGKECNDDLWKAFSEQRKAFFKNRDAYYSSLNEKFAQRVEQKKELIATAKKCLANSAYTPEEIASVKEIRNQWKAIGNCGKDNEEALYAEFNEIMNLYFSNMKYYK